MSSKIQIVSSPDAGSAAKKVDEFYFDLEGLESFHKNLSRLQNKVSHLSFMMGEIQEILTLSK